MNQRLLIFFLLLAGACSAPGPTPPSAVSTSVRAATVSPAQTVSAPGADANAATSPPATSVPLPTPTSGASADLTRLMDGGCCVNPMWTPDSQSVLFIDKPTPQSPTGLYQVLLDAPGQSKLWSERIAFYTRDLDYAQIPSPTGTRLIRIADGKEFPIANGGRQVSLSPDRTRIAWSESRDTFPIEDRVTSVMVANLDGTGAKRVTQLLRGGVSGWLDADHLLLSGRASRDTEDTTLAVYDLRDGAQTVLVTAERMRLTSSSPGGSWLAYVITNDSDPARNGLWVVRTDGTAARKLDFFGPLQWRDDTHFVYAPLDLNAPTHSFYEYAVETGETRRLTPADRPFKIASGDWALSPDGLKIVFVNTADNNLWLWRFPSP